MKKNSTGKTILQKYLERPEIYENISLLNFAKTIYVRGGRYIESRVAAICRVFPKLQLVGNSENDEKFYKLQCILNIPFRNNYETILQSNNNYNTWAEVFEHSECLKN